MTDRDHEDVTTDRLAQRFDADRPQLIAMAYRMLGSLSEAEDALQESWLHASRADIGRVDNLSGWLNTVVGRVCLDMLRSRKARREELMGASMPDPVTSREEGFDPEQEALMADSVGSALLVVLDTLAPAERLAYVLHDMFAVPFDQIAPIAGRTPAAARKLASRARRRIQTAPSRPDADPHRQWQAVHAFLAAAREGDFDQLVAVLDPDVAVRADAAAAPAGTPTQVRGSSAVAEQALSYARRAEFAQLALVGGALGIVVAPHGRPRTVMAFTVEHGKIVEIDIVADPARLHELDLTILD